MLPSALARGAILPSAPARESDQGQLRTCTRHALAKAVVDGFQDKIFHHQEIDLDQEMVTNALLAMDQGQEMVGVWPDRFNFSQFQLQERLNGQGWKVKIYVDRIISNEVYTLIEERTRAEPTQTHIMVHRHRPLEPNSPLHCIYIKKLSRLDSPNYNVAVCIDSVPGGNDIIRLDKPGNIFYRVWCRADPVNARPMSC